MNNNPILGYARDEYYRGCDIFGLGMAWQFAVADHLFTRGVPTPPEWEYLPSFFGADDTAPEYLAIVDALDGYGDAEQEQFLLHAGRVFDHLNNLSRITGQAY